jgi:hypothetical protein
VDRKKLEQLFNRYRDPSEQDKIGEPLKSRLWEHCRATLFLSVIKQAIYPAAPLPRERWWASYFHKVTKLLYFRYCSWKLVTLNPVPIFPCNGSVTVTIY